MFGRSILKADVVREIRALPAPNDYLLTLGSTERLPGRFSSDTPLFPCSFDIARARTAYVPDLNFEKLRKEPFSYPYAAREAKTVLFVPWEMGQYNRPRATTDPLYVFSPGRCGSTLLHKILSAANVCTVSEPLVHIAVLSEVYRRHRVVRPLLNFATRTYARDLVNAFGQGCVLVVKLQADACWAMPPLLERSRERRTIFMTRRFEEFARSFCENFGATPEDLVKRYRQSLRCYAYLLKNTDCHLVRYEALIERPGSTMERLAEFLGHDIPSDAIDAAMSVHSQAGTPMERATEEGRERWRACRDETLRYWQASGMAEVCSILIGY